MRFRFIVSLWCVILCAPTYAQIIGKSEITRWQYGKKAAVSLTFDDGSINQFTVALPILNKLDLPATFFIITGQIPQSKYQGTFIGRPVKEIIAETATTPTRADNFFERASAVGFLGYQGTLTYHTQAGGIFDESNGARAAEAYSIIDEGYAKVRNGDFQPRQPGDRRSGVTWDQIQNFAKQGHEFASHTVTHPRLAVLDEINMRYELEKSKEEILNHLGARHTFSAEGPYGTENERVMRIMYGVYPALRNRMPEPFLEELNRWSELAPGASSKPYVQWQRGATTQTPLPMMKRWVDTVMTHNNNWLVLVFHGVDGIGYEALSHELLGEYFQYIKDHDAELWVATFGDVTKYMRERMSASLTSRMQGDKIEVLVDHPLDHSMYDLPLTVRTYIPAGWKKVSIVQGNRREVLPVVPDPSGSYVQFLASPGSTPILLTGAN